MVEQQTQGDKHKEALTSQQEKVMLEISFSITVSLAKLEASKEPLLERNPYIHFCSC